ncbi:MAG: hypothetical protein IIW60_06280 [Alistipes sp.]|nr:hypothetical protein [Alistipes sp.]
MSLRRNVVTVVISHFEERMRLIRNAAFHCYGSAKYVNILCSRFNRSVATSD